MSSSGERSEDEDRRDYPAEYTSLKRMPGSYHSPLSGFLQLPRDDKQGESSYNTSTESIPTTYEPSDAQSEEEPALMRSKLGLQVAPSGQAANKLSKHTSTQTLRAESENVDLSDDGLDLKWDNDSQINIMPAAAYPPVTSNTWSASSKVARSISHALKYSDEVRASSPTNLSCSLPTLSHMPHNLVKESWDEDFLFQDDGGRAEAESSSGPSTGRQINGHETVGRGDWDEEYEDDEEWEAPSSIGKDNDIPVSASNSTVLASRADRLPIDSSHLEQSGSSLGGRDPGVVPSSPLQSFNFQSRTVRLADALNDTGTETRFRDKFAARSDNIVRLPMSTPPQSLEVKRSPTTARRASSGLEEAPRSITRNGSENVLQRSVADSPAKAQPRLAEGHWSHFLSAKLGQVKSPEKTKRSKQVKDFGNITVPRITSPSTHSPPVSPSAMRSRELSMSQYRLNEGETSNISKGAHRRGGASLSMSFGLMAPWGWSNRSSHRTNEAAGSLAGASTSSVSLASITADTGRPAEDTVKFINTSSANNDLQDVYNHASANSSIGSKRKLVGQMNLTAEEKKGQDAASTMTNLTPQESKARAMIHSPSSFRAPLMTQSSRSHSGSTSTATTAMSSSDCATSTGSIIEESTLYESIDDATKVLSPLDSSSFKAPIRTPSLQRNITPDANVPYSADKVPVNRRIRVSTTRPADGIDNIRSSPSATEIQFRLPSDPSFSTSIKSRDWNDNEQYGRSSTSVDSSIRRNSLSDLKIPSRITKAQEGIRMNMNRVKDFASGIEDLRALREQYQHRISGYSTTDATRLEVEEEYSSWWECAEVLIGLGQGNGGDDDEANVDRLEQIQPFTAPPSDFSTARHLENTARRTSTISFGPNHASRSISGARPPSSRASSSRSIDPQREIDILSAMLAGTPVEDISPNRPGILFRERTMSANEGLSSSNKPGGSIMRQYEAQGQLPLAGISATSLSFAEVHPSHQRSRSHRTTASLSTSAYFQRRRDAAAAASSQSLLHNSTGTMFPGTVSTESVDTQGTTRRLRIRGTGKAGLQGLKELLRMFKMTSAALTYQGEASQSRISLKRTMTDEPRISFEDATATGEEAKLKPVSRTRSLFSKSMNRSTSHSPSLQRHLIPIKVDETHVTSRSSSMTSSHEHLSSRRSIRVSSGAESSTKDTSLDSEWTQSDFDQLNLDEVISESRPEFSLDGPDTPSAKSSAGKRRFFLFSKGFPPSAARRHSRDVLHWASDSRESINLSPARHSLQLPARDTFHSPPHSPPGGMPRATSSAKHPLLNSKTTTLNNSRTAISGRSLSTSSSFSSGSQSSNPLILDFNATVRPSKGSATATVNTVESNSSSGTQIATPNTEAFQIDQGNSPKKLPPPRSSQDTTHTHRKLALKPEAIPSLLVYLETTKARCQESISLL